MEVLERVGCYGGGGADAVTLPWHGGHGSGSRDRAVPREADLDEQPGGRGPGPRVSEALRVLDRITGACVNFAARVLGLAW